ncbi:hypothetical protein VRRI112168_02400 [Vreelandella rituensis]
MAFTYSVTCPKCVSPVVGTLGTSHGSGSMQCRKCNYSMRVYVQNGQVTRVD